MPEQPAATLRRSVVFEETGEERAVKRACARCAKSIEGRFFAYSPGVVSPSGIEHIGVTGGDTACGIDATGPGWWWPL